MTSALLSLGSNIEPERNLTSAAASLRQKFPGIIFSPVYQTKAVGFAGPDFSNAGAIFDTDMGVLDLDEYLHQLEDQHGRRRDLPRFSDRSLDIDLALYGQLQVSGPGNLRIPRAELCHAFVLKPLADIAGEFIEPQSGRSLAALWADLRASQSIELLPLALKL